MDEPRFGVFEVFALGFITLCGIIGAGVMGALIFLTFLYLFG